MSNTDKERAIDCRKAFTSDTIKTGIKDITDRLDIDELRTKNYIKTNLQNMLDYNAGNQISDNFDIRTCVERIYSCRSKLIDIRKSREAIKAAKAEFVELGLLNNEIKGE